MIPFNKPFLTGKEAHYMYQAVLSGKISGNGMFTKKCQAFLEEKYGFKKCLLTTSGTDALEMCAMLCDLKPGDEVIVPSYTFVSTALAFLREGAKVVFADSCSDNPNIDPDKIESLITPRTRVIAPVHYAGVSCEMDTILSIAKKHGLFVIEDAAQGVMSSYKGRALGSIGNFGCYSFHETKNYSMGEGGALLINDAQYADDAEIIREKGTNRSQFWRGKVDKYRWVDVGSSYLPSELNAAYLYAQLEHADEIFSNRMESWNRYYNGLGDLAAEGKITLPFIPDGCVHNAHMFYIKVKDIAERSELITYLKARGVETVFHYIPLHTAPAGLKCGRFHGEDRYTTAESERLLRLPMYYKLTPEDSDSVINGIKDFYSGKK